MSLESGGAVTEGSTGGDLRSGLVALAALDQALDDLRRRRGELPERHVERRAAARLMARSSELESLVAAESAARERQAALEASSEALSRRAGTVRRRLRGPVSPPAREIPLLEEELASVEARERAAEEEAIGLLEEIESLGVRRRSAEEELRQAKDELRRARERLRAAEGEVDAAALELLRERPRLLGRLPAEVRERYEHLRRALGGQAVVVGLDGRRCGGCHLELSAVELEALHRLAEHDVGNCESCGRFLVPGLGRPGGGSPSSPGVESAPSATTPDGRRVEAP